jgi:hypothetical protein
MNRLLVVIAVAGAAALIAWRVAARWWVCQQILPDAMVTCMLAGG